MRSLQSLAALLLALTVVACSGIETHPADTAEFEAANYRYYTWRNPPLQNTSNSRDPIYLLDGIIREAVDQGLQDLGYRLDPKLAQFDVHFLAAPGMRQGVGSEQVSNISTRPQAINRQVDQASIDNAQALAGVRDTENIALLFNDVERVEQVWHVVITKLVEDANFADTPRLRNNVNRAIKQGLKTLPRAR